MWLTYVFCVVYASGYQYDGVYGIVSPTDSEHIWLVFVVDITHAVDRVPGDKACHFTLDGSMAPRCSGARRWRKHVEYFRGFNHLDWRFVSPPPRCYVDHKQI